MPKEAKRPDIEIGAAIKAKKLRIDSKPDSDSRYEGDWTSVSDRNNLPDEVEEGVTYRDVEIRWDVKARMEERQLEDQGTKPRGRKKK
jgi:hypothetical protein